jgi:Leucine rich repeat
MKLYKTLKSALEEPEEVEALKITLTSKEFPPEIFFFENLEEIYLDGACEVFPKIGTPWKRVKVLSIKFPQFQGDLSALFNLPTLENLKILETPQKRIILPLGHLTSKIKSLTLKNCSLESLPEEFSMLSELTELNLSGNALTALPHSFVDLKKLKRLNLDSNSFEKFPDLIKKMPALSHLSIDLNKFSEEEKARIQREFFITPA